MDGAGADLPRQRASRKTLAPGPCALLREVVSLLDVLERDGRALHAVRKDPAWNGQNHSISAANDEVRQMFTDWLAELCEGDTELFRKVVPKYPVGAKRILLDNGNWMRALRRDNVHLVDEPVPGADAYLRTRRQGTAGTLERRSACVPRHHLPGFSEPVLLLRAEHQHRGERQHHLFLGVRGALHPGLHRPAAERRACRTRLPPRRARRLQPGDRCRESREGLGCGQRPHLVQEHEGPGHPELAVSAGRVPAPQPYAYPPASHFAPVDLRNCITRGGPICNNVYRIL